MVKKISYKGREYPIRISYKALKGVVGELGREFRGNADVFDFEGAEALLFHAMKAGCDFAGEELDLKREQMVDVLDESLNEFIAAFTAFTLAPAGATQQEATSKKQTPA